MELSVVRKSQIAIRKSHPPGRPWFAVEHAVSLFVIEALLDRVPLEFAAEAQAEGHCLADGNGAVRDLRVADGRGAAADAVDQVAHVAGGVAPTRSASSSKT